MEKDGGVSVAFLTLGCKVNFYETEKLAEQFGNAGYVITEFTEPADVYIVNTCTVTNIADRKSRKMLHRASRLNEKALVVAMGCFAQAQEESLQDTDGIGLVITNKDKDQAFDIITKEICRRLAETAVTDAAADVADRIAEGTADAAGHMSGSKASDERTRAYVKVQDGCNQFCSYCKIPYVRGKLKSREESDVIEEIRGLALAGYKEVVITGIHLSSYGVDRSGCRSFTELNGVPLYKLIAEIAAIDGIERIRLGSLEPRVITEEFVSALSGIGKLCPHFHLSMQSGCDETLARMNRKYTSEEFFEACVLLRKYFDAPAITTDVIVGFPGETDDEFDACRHFVEKTAFSDLHVFKYSKRDGTKAAVMPLQIDEHIKNERSRQLIHLGNEMSHKYAEQFIGKPQKCLVEEVISIDEKQYWAGHNERYLKIIFEYDDNNCELENCIVNVVPETTIESNILKCTVKNTLRK